MKMTKRIDTFQALHKTYEGRMSLGAVTASYDAATPLEDIRDTGSITSEALRAAAERFKGNIMQIPPMFSAVKVDGRRLYTLARKGLEVERQERPVEIMKFELLEISVPEVRFRVECSKGTYVRTLVHDLGQALGCGAYLSELRRTAIGAFTADEAWTIDELSQSSPRRFLDPMQPEIDSERLQDA